MVTHTIPRNTDRGATTLSAVLVIISVMLLATVALATQARAQSAYEDAMGYFPDSLSSLSSGDSRQSSSGTSQHAGDSLRSRFNPDSFAGQFRRSSSGESDLKIKQFFPDTNSFVLVCDLASGDFRPSRFNWEFGDGEKLVDVQNGDVYHTFPSSDEYLVKCSGTDGSRTRDAQLKVSAFDSQHIANAASDTEDPGYSSGGHGGESGSGRGSSDRRSAYGGTDVNEKMSPFVKQFSAQNNPSISMYSPLDNSYGFDCNLADGGFQPIQYSWNFGDGTTYNAVHNNNIMHQFMQGGNYTIACQATDGINTKISRIKVSVDTLDRQTNPYAYYTPYGYGAAAPYGGVPYGGYGALPYGISPLGPFAGGYSGYGSLGYGTPYADPYGAAYGAAAMPFGSPYAMSILPSQYTAQYAGAYPSYDSSYGSYGYSPYGASSGAYGGQYGASQYNPNGAYSSTTITPDGYTTVTSMPSYNSANGPQGYSPAYGYSPYAAPTTSYSTPYGGSPYGGSPYGGSAYGGGGLLGGSSGGLAYGGATAPYGSYGSPYSTTPSASALQYGQSLSPAGSYAAVPGTAYSAASPNPMGSMAQAADAVAAYAASAAINASGAGSNATNTTVIGAPTAAAADTADPNTILITSRGFVPSVLSVPKGTIVTWKNTDQIEHTASSVNKTFDSGLLFGGETYSYTFAMPGDYTYKDTLRNAGVGMIKVS